MVVLVVVVLELRASWMYYHLLTHMVVGGVGGDRGQMLSKPVLYPRGPPESSYSVCFYLSHLGLLSVPKGVVWHCRSLLCLASRGNLEIRGTTPHQWGLVVSGQMPSLLFQVP